MNDNSILLTNNESKIHTVTRGAVYAVGNTLGRINRQYSL